MRFIYLIYLTPVPDPGRTYLPSLILVAILAVTGVLLIFLGVFGELLRAQRRIAEENLYMMRHAELKSQRYGN